MKKPGRRPGKTASHLSEEDERLWEHTARSLEPLQRAKGRVLEKEVDTGVTKPPTEASRTEPSRAKLDPGALKTRTPAIRSPAAAKAPPLADFDRKAARKIRTGQAEIEARLDLHGMRQEEAHSALRGFILGCHGRGVRWVLVITGKGSVAERGVLRRNVPMWLAQPDLRFAIVSFTPAAIKHGGEGALYIHLRSRGR